MKRDAAYYEEQGREYARTPAPIAHPYARTDNTSWQAKAFRRGYEDEVAKLGSRAHTAVAADPTLKVEGMPRDGVVAAMGGEAAGYGHASEDCPVQHYADLTGAPPRNDCPLCDTEDEDRTWIDPRLQTTANQYPISSTGNAVAQHIDSLLEMARVETNTKRRERLANKANKLSLKWFHEELVGHA